MQTINQTVSQMELGPVVTRTDIRSSLSPFHHFPEYKVSYPQVVIEALLDIYREYNTAFTPLVEANREWATDYQHSLQAGVPINWSVQIDMIGLTDDFLTKSNHLQFEAVRESLLRSIFEIENSVAMYQLLERLFEQDKYSQFKFGWRAVLNSIRKMYTKPIALLAVTQQKYDAMATSEFGFSAGEIVPDQIVRSLSGFDTFWGPDQFLQHLQTNNGHCGHLLYVRSSDPVSKLRKPNSAVDHPLLSDPLIRQIIKANALTFNVDDPEMTYERRINDSKGYMPHMGLGFQIQTHDALSTQEFERYLQSVGLDMHPYTELRAKPLKASYGCYGHVRGKLSDKKFLSEVRRNIQLRGGYIIQPERQTPIVHNSTDPHGAYTYIDRNFIGLVNGKPQFIGGFRNHMPLHTVEAKEGRIHGNHEAVWAEILPE